MAIQILSGEVIDRIAAGEVLDRPANLIKELIENSLDAGADEIEVEFASGGRSVFVRDNGRGMDPSDLELALHRHATSKISGSEDLFRLHSFGFRGEALASVAAVSRLTLTSRTSAPPLGGPHRSGSGARIESEFGVQSEVVSVSAQSGTEIRVNDLFENVPARLKFLKSEAAEHGQIKTTLKALALAHENVGFCVRSAGELVFLWPKGQSFRDRAVAVLGTEELHAGIYEIDGFRAEVLAGSPQISANVNRSLWFFCQRRWIQDRSLTASVMEAYRNLLMTGQYPVAVARLTCPAESVDVNVHPTKSQVKFQNAQLAFRAVNRAVRQVLEGAPWLAGGSAASGGVAAPLDGDERAHANLQFKDREFERTQYPTKAFPLAQIRELVKPYNPDATCGAAGNLQAPDIQTDTQTAHRWADLQVVGQINRTYIVAQSADSFYLVDQHAAHERVMFERLMESFRAGRIEMQNLLIPLVLDFPAPEVDALLARQAEIEKFGINLERMGPESLAIQAIPSLVKEAAISEALSKLAFELSENIGEAAWERAVGEIFASMACHSVIRAGQAMSEEEMKSLLEQMDHYPLSSFCPHGRPVYIKRRFAEIEREFGRIQ